MVALAMQLKSTCHILIHGEKRQKGKLSSVQWGLTTLRCARPRLCIVLRECEWCSVCSISEGLRDVISHSVLVFIKWPSRHGSPTKASPFPARAPRVTGQLEQGAVTCSMLWLELWGGRSQAGDAICQRGPQRNEPWLCRSRVRWRSHIFVPALHVAPAIELPPAAVQTTPPRGGFGHESNVHRATGVALGWRSSSPVNAPNTKSSVSVCGKSMWQSSVKNTAGEWSAAPILAMMRV